MPNPSIPKYTLHKPTGQARVRINGRDHYLGKFNSPESHQKYRELMGRWILQSDLTYRELPELTIAQLTIAYFSFAERYYVKDGAPSGHLHVVRNGLRYLNHQFRSLPAAEFGPKKLMALRQKLIEKNLSRKYVNDLISVVKRMFRWAAREELVPVTVHQGLLTVGMLSKGRCAAKEPPPIGPVPDSMIEAVKPHVAVAIWGLIQFQRTTGARPGEALIVRGCDLNMSGSVWEFVPSRHKLEHKQLRRIVMIGPAGQKALQPFLRPDLTAYLFSPDVDGIRPYRRDSYRNAIVRGCEHAFGMPPELRNVEATVTRQQDLTVEDWERLRRKLLDEAAAWRRQHCWHPNQLRHTFATMARRAAGIEAARVTLGHSSAITSEIYAERDLEAARRVVKKIG